MKLFENKEDAINYAKSNLVKDEAEFVSIDGILTYLTGTLLPDYRMPTPESKIPTLCANVY